MKNSMFLADVTRDPVAFMKAFILGEALILATVVGLVLIGFIGTG